MLPLARRRSRRVGLSPQIMLALDDATVHALTLDPAGLRRDETKVNEARSWPRSEVTAERAGKAFMRDKVLLHVPDAEEPLTLYAPSLRTNPWSAEVVRLLGGDAPEPLDRSPARKLTVHANGRTPRPGLAQPLQVTCHHSVGASVLPQP